jgi:hypothetical protein
MVINSLGLKDNRVNFCGGAIASLVLDFVVKLLPSN